MPHRPEYIEAIARIFHERDHEEVGERNSQKLEHDRALQRKTPWPAWMAIVVAMIALAIALLAYGPKPAP